MKNNGIFLGSPYGYWLALIFFILVNIIIYFS